MNKKRPVTPIETDAFMYIVISALLLFSMNRAFSQTGLGPIAQEITATNGNSNSDHISVQIGLVALSSVTFVQRNDVNQSTAKLTSFSSVEGLPLTSEAVSHNEHAFGSARINCFMRETLLLVNEIRPVTASSSGVHLDCNRFI
jgi:hypothetical protein